MFGVLLQLSLALSAQLHQQALQIAALESLTNALDYHEAMPKGNIQTGLQQMSSTLAGVAARDPQACAPLTPLCLDAATAPVPLMHQDRYPDVAAIAARC